MKFKELIEDSQIAEGLAIQGIEEPTEVQADVYPLIKEQKNVIARSQTGSGKTLAYLIPLMEQIDEKEKRLYTIILVPTYELSMQVLKQAELLASNSKKEIRVVSIIGNGNINRQIELLKRKPHIIIGTSQRIFELIKRKKIMAHTVNTLVIDEADKMMDKNNLQPMLDVRKCLYKNIQILMFSASMNKKALEKAGEIAVDASVIQYQDKETIPDTIQHVYVITTRKEKIETVRSICSAVKPNKCMIFFSKQYDTQEAFDKLKYHHYKVELLTGKRDKLQRKNAIERFQTGKANYLMATDVAARGLHIDHVDTVINLSLPADTKDYLHRCGRCGRNNEKGLCISVITENELEKVKMLQKAFGINMVCKKLYNGKLVRG